jgi:hypothetical protein
MPDVLNKVISFIAGSGDGGDDKQILLKQIIKDIAQNKYTKFYRVRQEEADPSFAQYFYSIYKIIYPARVFLKDHEIMAKIKQVTLESHLDKNMMDIIKRLTPDKVAERKKSGPEVTAELEKDLETLTVGFDSPKLAEADRCYNLILGFRRFVSWDFHSFLRKFDPEFSDNFSVVPKFTALRTDTIMADIASFLTVLPSFDPKDDWKKVLEIFKYCKGRTDLIPFEVWNGLLANLRDLKQSRMLEMMIRLASGNPVWELRSSLLPVEQLSADWLSAKTRDIREVITGIIDNQKSAQIASLEKAVFGTNDAPRLIYYTKERGKILTQKDVLSYIYAPALNHLLAFIQDFIMKEMQELADLLLVRGQWTKNASSITMSDAYHTILDMVLEINELDETLAEDGHNGPRIRGALLRVDRDPGQARYLNSIVSSLNEEALNIISRTMPAFIVIGKHLKMLAEDCQKKPYDLIMNWKELIQLSKIPLPQRLGDDYKKVNYFIQLMLLEAKDGEEEAVE